MMDFPLCDFIFETVTTPNFFENVYRICSVKVHIHYSHITVKICGYAHDFWNWKVRENQILSSCIAHNYLNFHFYFMLRVFRCGTNGVNIGGNGLSQVNFANVYSQIKIIDTMKYLQAILAKIASTVIPEEKEKVKN